MIFREKGFYGLVTLPVSLAGLFLITCFSLTYASECDDIYIYYDLATQPPIDIEDTCLYRSEINLSGRTLNNYGRIGAADIFNVSGSIFTNYGEYANLQNHGYIDPEDFGADRDDYLFGSLYIDNSITGAIGHFNNLGGLYNDVGNEIGVLDGGILDGDGHIRNYGFINNFGVINTTYIVSVDTSSGSFENNGSLSNYAGGQWYSDVMLNGPTFAGQITNYQDAEWTIGLGLANTSIGVVDNQGEMTNRGDLENDGVFSNSGNFYNHGTFYLQNEGVVQNDSNFSIVGGGELHQTAGNLVNNGNLRIVDGRYQLSGGDIKNHGIFSDSRKGQFITTGSGDITNHGLLSISDSIDVNTIMNHAGEITVGKNLAAQKIVNDGGALTVKGDINVGQSINLSGGIITASQLILGIDSTMSFTGGTLSVDEFFGSLVNEGGTLAPGSSPGTTNISGDYVQLLDGVFEVEIGGLIQGFQYDWLNVDGTATLGGTLDVDLFDFGSGMFDPSLGDTFDILSADSIFGEFDFLDLVDLGNDLFWDIAYIFDNAGTDYVRLSVVSDSAPVPEPSTFILLGSGLAGLALYRRKKKKA